ncbi:hypothetical protein L6452_31107 [Arctium lappa]|uniref:Uncharacterized protein n=1 Tax=Arctium lappa TaxID=4217 RepID=A0ACB8ZL60_ARCLA|nr:hypothetical protein L6452_31107 [Arctium lappa]
MNRLDIMELEAAIATKEAALAKRKATETALAQSKATLTYLEKESKDHDEHYSKLGDQKMNPVPCLYCLVRGKARECGATCIFRPAVVRSPKVEEYIHMTKLYGHGKIKKWLKTCVPERRAEFLECLSKEAQLRILDPIRGAGGQVLQDDAKRANMQRQLETIASQQAMIASLQAENHRSPECQDH